MRSAYLFGAVLSILLSCLFFAAEMFLQCFVVKKGLFLLLLCNMFSSTSQTLERHARMFENDTNIVTTGREALKVRPISQSRKSLPIPHLYLYRSKEE